MVDREARDKMAELLRHLASGTITCQEFDAQFPVKCQDQAVRAVERFHWDMWEELCYQLDPSLWLDATQEGRFRGIFALPVDMRGNLLWYILFLQSDYEYIETTLSLEEFSIDIFFKRLLVFVLKLILLGFALAAPITLGLMIAITLDSALLAVILLPTSALCSFYLGTRIIVPWLGFGESPKAEEEDTSDWPFSSVEEYEEALKHPKLLCGKRAV